MSKHIDPDLYFNKHSPKAYYARKMGAVRLGAPGELIVGRNGAHLLDEHVALITDHSGSVTALSLDNFSKLHGGALTDQNTAKIGAPFKALRVKEDISFKTGWGEEIRLSAGDVLTRERGSDGQVYYDGFSAADFNQRHLRVGPHGEKIADLKDPAPTQTRAVKHDVHDFRNKKAHLQDIQQMKELGMVRADAVPRAPLSVLRDKTQVD